MEPLQLIEAFVNTADLEAGEDELVDAPGLVGWLADRGLVVGPVYATRADAAQAREMREALRELLRANNGIDVDRDRASATLDEAARRTGLAVRFGDGDMRFVPTRTGVAGGLAQVLGAVGHSMFDGSWTRLKACRSDTCRWAFVDHARNQSRQWCDMAVCGNRAKARTFRRRHRP
jgi:predicted RNA-binding Zn ribbon-like protein